MSVSDLDEEVVQLRKKVKQLAEQRSLDQRELEGYLGDNLRLKARVADLESQLSAHRATDILRSCRPADVEHETTLCLDLAKEAVMGDRARDYGLPSHNHSRTASYWSLALGVEVSPRMVCKLNILQKISRDECLPKPDNMVDIAGWAQNASWVSDAEEEAAP